MRSNTRPVTAAESGSFALGGELEVRRLGFGAMRITGRGVWGPPKNPEEAKRVLRRAVELGVNLIDTADSYGPEVSERLIAEALHPYPEGLVIATKGGYTRHGRESWEPDGRPEHLRRACEGSLGRLRLETIDLYQFHTPDPDVPFEESIGALADLQAEGKIRMIGLSSVSVDELETGRRIVEVVSVQNRYNLEDRDSEDVLDHCAELEIGFIPWFPLASGDLVKKRGTVRKIAETHHATPAQIAIAWLLRRAPVVLPIPGTANVEHLEENVAAAAIEISDDEFERLT